MTWETFEQEIGSLVAKIQNRPDIIVGISRGGIVPARLLSSQLAVPTMHCMSVEKRKRVLTNILEDIHGKNILLVEDAIDTGRNLIMVKKYLEEKGAVVYTACLYTSPRSETTPDYFLRQVDATPEFPWE